MRAEQTIFEVLASQADVRGGSVALRSVGTETLTYSQLLERIHLIRTRLHAAGVRRGDRVAIVLPNGIDAAIAFLAVASTATAAPLNPLYRPAEFEFYFDDLRPKALIVADCANPVVAVAQPRNIAILSDPSDNAASPPVDADLPQGDDVALVLHTSGTTSRPKIVPLTQANLCSSARNISEWLRLTPDDRCLNIMPLFHIHGLAAALLSSLRAGGSVICSPGFISTEFFGWVQSQEPTWYTAVPTMHQAILARPEAEQFDRARSRLRFIRSSSAPLPPVVAKGLEERFGVPVVEAYGMTEASHQMCSNPLPPATRKFGSVGLPAGLDIAIMNRDGQLLPRGESGEVVIRGANVTRGYEGNGEANAGAFTHGWFRTGDIGFLDRDGYLHLSGRSKEIINRGGEKISPREVDETLLEHPAVAEALTFALPDPRLGEEIAAVVVLRSGSPATESELMTFAARKLAEFKVPRRILIRDEIPKGPTGKPQRIGLADRLGLKSIEQQPQRPHVEPRSETEKTIAEIWKSVLKIDSISADAGFFEVGGDSILATQVVARVQQQTGRDVPIVLLFQSPTIAEMARAIDANVTAISALPSEREANHTSAASFAQRRLWFLDQLNPGSLAYNNAHTIRLRGTLDAAAVRDGIQKIVDRHDALRSRFTHRDGVPIIHVQEALKIELPVVDLSSRAATEREAEIRRLSVEIAREPFDLATGPLVRFLLLKLGEHEHALLFVVHHIVSDRWSLGIFGRELLHALSGEPSELSAPMPYLDYAAEQHRDSAAVQSHIQFWRSELSPLPAPFELYSDHARPAVQSMRGGLHRFRLPLPLTQSLRALARSRGTTLFTVMLAAFETFLFRYTGQEDAVLGTAIAGRNRVELESIIGLFINVLPVRSRIRGGMLFNDVIAQTRAAMLGVIAHQDLPFDTLVDALQAPRDPSRSPIFQVLFNYRNVPAPDGNATGVEAAIDDVDLGISRFDLTLSIDPSPNEFAATFEYCRDLFAPESIEHLSENFLMLLESIVTAPDSPISQLQLLSPRQRREILIDWNHGAIDAPPALCVHEMFEEQVHRTPEATALICGTEHITYAELNRRANQFAHHLRSMGVGPESLVGICLGRTSPLIVAILGVLKSGGAYVPLDPEYPPQRLAFILEDSKSTVLVTQQSHLPSLAPGLTKVICVDRDAEPIAREASENPPRVSQPNHLAYVIYTSGSTGRPKGVAIEHRAPASLARWAKTYFSDREMSAVLGVASVCFDLSVFEIFLSLTRGTTLILAANALQLGDCPAADEATFAFLVPSVFAEMLHTGQVPRNLIGLALGGEAVPESLARRAIELPDVETVYNLYGPTEDTVISVAHPIPRDEAGAPPIGKSIGGGRAYILGANLHPVPIGVAGELHLGGIKVARGYLHQPELTAERFVADPFGPAGSKLFRTGDLCRFRHDGNIQFISRIDHQIKVRGFRIELGEVESVLSKHPAVRQCCVTAEGEGADRRLVAYVTTTDPRPTALELRRHMATFVPAHMVPSAFIFLDAMPLNSSGKVDRAALSNAQAKREQPPVESAEPSTALQKQLAEIWCAVLGIDRVGLHDNFFEIGGHSLRAVSTIARIEESLRLSVPLRAVFEHSTVERLAAFVESHRQCVPQRPRSIEPSVEDDGLSPGQRTLWFEHHYAGESGLYNVLLARRLFGPVDPARLERALNGVVARHEMLRAYFPSDEGMPLVKTGAPDALHVSVPVIDCRSIPSAAREAEVQRILRAESETPFTLERPPLIRANLLQIDDQQFVFTINMHHIVIDDWSLRILCDEIGRFYANNEALPPVRGRYADFTASLCRWMTTGDAERQFAYWKSQLAGAPALLVLPTDRPRPTVQTFRGARERVHLPAATVRKLYHVAKSERATEYMALLTAFNLLLAQWTGETDLVITSPSANRQRPDVQGQIGYFLNMLPLRIKLPREVSVREALRIVRGATIDAFENQEFPFESMIERLRPRRAASHTPWTQVIFVHLTEGPPKLHLPNIRSEPIAIEDGWAKCDLALMLDEVDGGIEGSLDYNSDLFNATTIEQLARRFESLAEWMAENPDQTFSASPGAIPTTSTPSRESPVVARNAARRPNATEAKLLQIWRDVLGVPNIALDDDFFELGGNSFLVVRTLSQIRRHFNRKLPVAMLFEASTIAKLGALLDGSGDEPGDAAAMASEYILSLQTEGDGVPLFLAPGAEGHALVFRDLVKLLGNERPIYALQFSEIPRSPSIENAMRDLAAQMIEHMRRVQPTGPYLLAGYSFGGTLAYEMAGQLVASGHEVDLLALFDSFPPGAVETKSMLRRLPVHASHLLRDGPRGARRHLKLVVQRLRERISSLFRSAEPRVAHPAEELKAACQAAYRSYRPLKYPGEVVLFCAIERDRWMDFPLTDYLNGWTELVQGDITVYNISATHSTILAEAHLGEVARQLNHCLQRTAARA